MQYLVVYTSETGNTQKVAMSIFEALPGRSKDIRRLEEVSGEEADTYFVGFWNDRGTCGSRVMDYLSTLHESRVALFGTCGMGGSREYFDQIAKRVQVFVPEDNDYMGCFLCAGKMPLAILDRYKAMQAVSDTPQIRTMIAAYEEGMLHPDNTDIAHAKAFVQSVLKG